MIREPEALTIIVPQRNVSPNARAITPEHQYRPHSAQCAAEPDPEVGQHATVLPVKSLPGTYADPARARLATRVSWWINAYARLRFRRRG